MSSPLVDIVTPVHNEEALLAECIESILAQTYRNWRYTIVDNCSTDASATIADSYAGRDDRIRVVRNPALVPALASHNIALRHISGDSKYCKVVFGDDWILPECLEHMVSIAEENPSVGVVGGYGHDGAQVLWTGLPFSEKIVSGRQACRRLFLDGLYLFGSATSLLYRSDLVRSHDPFYDEADLFSDADRCIRLMAIADFGFVHQILTFSRAQRAGSLREISEDLNTYVAGRLLTLVRHGPACLTPAEMDLCIARVLDDYYSLLSGGVLRFREKTFWEYHRRILSEAGVGFSNIRLARVMTRKLMERICTPKATVKKVRDIFGEALGRRPVVSEADNRDGTT